MAREMLGYCADLVQSWEDSRHGRYSFCNLSQTVNISHGEVCGATPDGRSAGVPVNNGVSPANGSERNGATAACNSVAKIPTIYDQKGNIFNMRLAPSTIANQESRQKILDMMRALFDKDAEQIQFNVVDNEVLKESTEKDRRTSRI